MKSSKDRNNLATAFFLFHKKSFCCTINYGLLVLLIAVVAAVAVFSGCSLLGGLFGSGTKTDVSAESVLDKASSQESQQQSSAESAEETQKETTTETQEATTESVQQTLTDTTDVINTGESMINVYYADVNGEYLVGEARTVSGTDKFVDAIYEMMKSPIEESLIILIPETVKINSVNVSGQVARADFSKNFVDDRFVSETVDILLVYSVVNTLTEFPEIHAVDFFINGSKLDILGQLDLKDPVYRRNDLIKE
jgi:germination protein M